jgi:hypothetical protein
MSIIRHKNYALVNNLRNLCNEISTGTMLISSSFYLVSSALISFRISFGFVISYLVVFVPSPEEAFIQFLRNLRLQCYDPSGAALQHHIVRKFLRFTHREIFVKKEASLSQNFGMILLCPHCC